MKVITALVLWVVCGLYNWGTIMADMNYDNGHDWAILNRHARDNAGLAGVFALLGPFWTPVAVFCTNFNQHGWELWEHKSNDDDIRKR